MIQKTSFIMNCLALLTSVAFVGLMTGCKNSEDIVEPDDIKAYLLIQSDNGQSGTGEVYRTSCINHKELRVERDGTQHMLYHLSFNCNIRESPVFYLLDIDFETDTEMSFDDLKVGDTFDTGQFHAGAYYTPTWMEAIMRGTGALSGKLTVTNRREVEGVSFITLELKNIKFDAIDHSCIYSVSGTLEYELP